VAITKPNIKSGIYWFYKWLNCASEIDACLRAAGFGGSRPEDDAARKQPCVGLCYYLKLLALENKKSEEPEADSSDAPNNDSENIDENHQQGYSTIEVRPLIQLVSHINPRSIMTKFFIGLGTKQIVFEIWSILELFIMF
jgi:hypothetical protein